MLGQHFHLFVAATHLCENERLYIPIPPFEPILQKISAKMSDKKVATSPDDRTVIGITFGNSNSSVAHTVDDKAEVIANEDGGERRTTCPIHKRDSC